MVTLDDQEFERLSANLLPDSDETVGIMRAILAGHAKPSTLTPLQSATWDKLAREIAEAESEHQVVEIPPP